MKKMKKFSLMLAAFAVMICASLFMVKDVEAAAKAPKLVKSKVDVFLVNENANNYYYSVNISNLKEDAVVTSVKSSNTSVFTVGYYNGNSFIQIKPHKTGKAVVSCTVKQNGKTYHLKRTVKVYKGKPIKTVKVNGKKVYKSGSNCVDFYTPKKNVKISFKLNSGWKIKRLYYNYHNYKGKLMTKNYNIKNGAKIKIGKGSHTSVKIDAVNKKGQIFRYLIMLYYDPDATERFYAPSAKEEVLLDGIK